MSAPPIPYKLIEADGNTKQFTYEFDIPGSFSGLYVWTQQSEDELWELRSDYHHDRNTKTITFNDLPPSGTMIYLARFTNWSQQAIFIGGQSLTGTSLNTEPARLTAVTQELAAGIGPWTIEFGPFNPTSVYMMKAPTGEYWMGQGVEVRNCAPGTTGSSLVTVDQAIGILTGSNPAFIDSSIPYLWMGDGQTTRYRLTDAPTGKWKRTTLNVHVAHVYQSAAENEHGDTVYEVYNITDEQHTWHMAYEEYQNDGTEPPEGYYTDPELVFATAPEEGAPIEARFVFGTAQVSLPETHIGSQQIVQGAIRVPYHIAPVPEAPGTPYRGLRFNAQGQPMLDTLRAAHIEDFDARVRANRLDQFQPPNKSLNLAGQAMTNVATPTGASPSHAAATKGYVQQQVNAGITSLGTNLARFLRHSSTFTLPANHGWTGWINVSATIRPDTIFVMSSQSERQANGVFVFSSNSSSTVAHTIRMVTGGGNADEMTCERQRSDGIWRVRFRTPSSHHGRMQGPWRVSFLGT